MLSIITKLKKKQAKRIQEYFYPDGYWAGYAKFHTPPMRGNNKLCSYIHNTLEHNSKQDCLLAIDLLANTHVKDVYKKHKSGKQGEVTCLPTEHAREAVKLLSNYKKYTKENID